MQGTTDASQALLGGRELGRGAGGGGGTGGGQEDAGGEEEATTHGFGFSVGGRGVYGVGGGDWRRDKPRRVEDAAHEEEFAPGLSHAAPYMAWACVPCP